MFISKAFQAVGIALISGAGAAIGDVAVASFVVSVPDSPSYVINVPLDAAVNGAAKADRLDDRKADDPLAPTATESDPARTRAGGAAP